MPGSLNTLEPDEELARRIAFDGLILRGLVGCYDTKYAMHALRIGLQGVELLQTGRISLPVSEPERSMLRAVRAGDVALKEVLSESMQPPAHLEQSVASSRLPREGDRARVDEWLVSAHMTAWEQPPAQPGAWARTPPTIASEPRAK